VATEPLLLFGGSGSPRLAASIADHLDLPLGRSEVHRFSEGNLFVRVLENVRGRRVYIVQSTSFPSNDNFMELLFWIDAFKRASAESVTAVVPYFSYAKGDKKDEPRVSIRARVCADAMEAAGVDRLVTMDLHAPQIQGFFRKPVDDLYALPVLCARVAEMNLPNLIVVAPDTGFAKKARKYARFLGTDLAIADKERKSHDERAEVLAIMGDVHGRTALLVDDFAASGGTLADAAHKLVELGAAAVYAMVTHAAFGRRGIARIEASPLVKVLVTDTVESEPVDRSSRLEVVSVAGLFAEAIRRVDGRQSISSLFPFAGQEG
jgi:ribose-phosphate pyrophosphokinase